MPFLEKVGQWIGQNLAGLIGAGGVFGQGIMNANVARENTDKTIAANKALAQFQYSKDVEMWNRGNVYNSPMAQMGRLKAAGLNPNMVYGSGSAAGMAAGQLPKYNAPTVSYNYQPPVDIPSAIAAFQNFRLGNAQIRNTEAQAENRWRDLGVLDADIQIGDEFGVERGTLRRFLKMQDYMSKKQKYSFGSQLFQSQKDTLEARLQNLRSENARIIAATKNLTLKNDYFAAEAIAGLFGKSMVGLGALGKMLGTRGGKASGALNPGTLTDKRLRALEMGSYYGSQRYRR